ncbi:MAG: MYXO-CTERM sorting domain-containing protein [Myxococcales bacterium]|nr:MYXO-CTERM sorting domain-containing protein [Myxococcales bacterium]
MAAMALLTAGAWPARAEACSCGPPKPRTLLPSVTSLAPATGPWLVMHGGDGVAELRSEQGDPLGVETQHSFGALALCSRQFDLLRPTTPLEAGARYELAISSTAGADSRSFRATDREPATLPVMAHVKLAHTVVDTESGGCSDPKLDGLHQKGVFAASVVLDQPALLFAELSASDSKFEQLSDGSATLSEGVASEFAISTTATAELPELDTTAECVTLKLFDARDAKVFDQELCPEPGKTLQSDHALTVSEHLIPEPGEDPESGCGCRVGPASRPEPWVAALLALAVVWRVRRSKPAARAVRSSR